ncbi:MAG: tRNA pseudouridine(38-40) synthase TruA [Gemmataceae bacterium]
MRNVKLVISYDGTDFSGWQTQPGKRTVQETLEQAIASVTGEKVVCNASGRTDAGVHAIGQVVNFHTRSALPTTTLLRALNARLPEDIVVRHVADVAEDFDACRHARSKRYRYIFHDGPLRDVFFRRYAWHVWCRLDVGAMQQGAQVLLGTHDFRSFETDWPNRVSSVRTITDLVLTRRGDTVWLELEADGFLYNMARAIAGTLFQVGRGYWPAEEVPRIVAARDRRRAGPTAPARGLYLLCVRY